MPGCEKPFVWTWLIDADSATFWTWWAGNGGPIPTVTYQEAPRAA